MDSLINWSFDIVPNFGMNFYRDPFWSPDVYSAVVWDNAISLEGSAQVKVSVELAYMTYFSIDVDLNLFRWSVGLQTFLMEEIPSHFCTMMYTESNMLTVGFNMETNTK